MGYSFENGRMDVSTHPFTGGAGPTDVRITTRFSDNWAEGFGATVHETGHALYEQARVGWGGRVLGERGGSGDSLRRVGGHGGETLPRKAPA